MDLDIGVVLMLCLAAFAAGLVDSMAGGGGLIQIPALLNALGPLAYPLVFGTNKLSSIVGTVGAAYRYATRVTIPWNALLPAMAAALVGAYLGAWSLLLIPIRWVELGVPIALALVAWHTYRNKQFGEIHAPRLSRRRERFYGAVLGFVIGFYDGIFGPGTGSFLLFGFVLLFGFDFLSATACAKFVNVVCNLAALLKFGASGHVWVGLGLGMAIFNWVGGQVGATLALTHGAGLVRRVLLGLVVVLIGKTAWQAYGPWLLACFT